MEFKTLSFFPPVLAWSHSLDWVTEGVPINNTHTLSGHSLDSGSGGSLSR